MNREDKISFLKQKATEFVANGGEINKLGVHDELYKLVKNSEIITDGRPLTVKKKFELIGFPRENKNKSFQEHVYSLHDAISKFVEEGGDVSTLCYSDKLYKKVKNSKLGVNGSELTIEQKFELVGFPRKPAYNPIKTLMDTLASLENYKDSQGYVDSFRSARQLNASLDTCSAVHKLPVSLLITLVANQKLKRYALNVDRYDYIKARLYDYISKHGNLVGIKQKDRRLYDLLCSTAKTYPTQDGQKISIAELVEVFGFGDYENNFNPNVKSSSFNPVVFLNKYGDKIIKNGNKISLSDISTNDYAMLANYTRRNSTTIQNFFKSVGVKYITPKAVKRDAYLTVSEYPYLDEMKTEVESLLAEYYHNNPQKEPYDAETLFKNRLTACQFVYEKYKEKIDTAFSNEESQSKIKSQD